MVRPRKHAQVNGRIIEGVPLHRATGRYYTIDSHGKQVYFWGLQAASEAYLRGQADPVAAAKENTAYAVRHAVMHQPEFFAKLAAVFLREEVARCQPDCSARENRLKNPTPSTPRTVCRSSRSPTRAVRPGSRSWKLTTAPPPGRSAFYLHLPPRGRRPQPNKEA